MTTIVNKIRSQQNIPIGDVTFWKKTNFGLSGITAEANFNISVYTENTIRVQISAYEEYSSNPYSVVTEPEGIQFIIDEQSDHILLKTDTIQLHINLTPFFLTYLNSEGQVINQDDPSFAVSWLGTEVTNYKKVQKNEKFIGLGEKTGNLNRAGKAYVNWNTDYFAYGESDDPLYMSIPFYIGLHSNLAYGIFLDNTHKSVFNFGASNNRFIYYGAEDGDMDYYFFHDEKVSDIISAYTKLTGKMEMPPIWSLGFQQCRYSYYPESEVITLANTFRDKGMPADVIYLDIHHMEKYKVFTFDGEKFPDPKSMIQKIKDKGFRVVVIMDPGIKTQPGYDAYDEGKERGLFVTYPDGEIYEGQVWPGWCAFPDYTNEEVRGWWGEKMAFYREAGVDGYWTDMNEPASWGQHTPNLINFSFEGEKVSHRKARNIYGMQMARSAMEGSLLQNSSERPFVLTRSGFSGIQRYAAAWTGDNVASDDHMLAGVRLVSSLGLSGVSFAGYDVGGFAGESTRELFARWMTIATFSPLYRAHSMINSSDSEPWAFGEETEEISRNYMQLRYRLMPTLYSAFYNSSQTGVPIVKSLAIDYPHDTTIYELLFQNQYIFCDSLMIAPVESFKEITKVYLPEGDWYYFFDGRKIEGNHVIYQDCPLNYLPVYVKGGSILAMQSDIMHTGDKHDGILRLHIYHGQTKNSYVHYEDDGLSLKHKEDGYYRREITWDSQEGVIQFGSIQGKFETTFTKIQIFVHGLEVNAFKLNDEVTEVTKNNLAFINKLTEFDPLPDTLHPYSECKNVPNFTITNTSKSFSISIL